jgi:hypothetical protein
VSRHFTLLAALIDSVRARIGFLSAAPLSPRVGAQVSGNPISQSFGLQLIWRNKQTANQRLGWSVSSAGATVMLRRSYIYEGRF